MDLLSEASSGGRVLVARHLSHISSDKASQLPWDVVNTTALCLSLDLPDIQSYVSALQFYGPLIWGCGTVIALLTIGLFCVTIRASIRHRPRLVSQTICILAVFPIISVMSLLVLAVPRMRLLSEAIAQEAVMIALYNLYLFIIGECGGPEQLVRDSDGSRLETRLPPCCCWPCCIIPRPKLQTKRLFTLRMLVLQMPIVQAMIYITLLVLWLEDPILYHNNLFYFQPFVAASILAAMWGMMMCVRAVEATGTRVRTKLVSLQLLLLIVKLQGGILTNLPKFFTLPCHPPLTATVYANMLHNGLMNIQVFFISIWAWRLYSAVPSKLSNKIQQVKVVAVLEDQNLPSILSVKNLKNGEENKCFKDEREN